MSPSYEVPVFAAQKFLRQLSRRKGRRRTAFVSAEVRAFSHRQARYRNNRSTPLDQHDPQQEYGAGIAYESSDPRVLAANLLRLLAEAVVTLPPGKTVSLLSTGGGGFGRRQAVAYFCGPSHRTTGPGQALPISWAGEFDLGAGALFHGQVQLPDAAPDAPV